MAEPLKPSIRVSGGNPASCPNFRPINKLPKHEQKALLQKRIINDRLYQVWVDDKNKGTIPVGPKCPQGAADSFAAAIRAQIILGREQIWAAPTVLPAI